MSLTPEEKQELEGLREQKLDMLVLPESVEWFARVVELERKDAITIARQFDTPPPKHRLCQGAVCQRPDLHMGNVPHCACGRLHCDRMGSAL